MRKSTLFFLCFMLSVITAQAQSMEVNEQQSGRMIIYLNDNLEQTSLNIDEQDSWAVINNKTGQTLSGTGKAIFKNNFSNPGDYMIRYSHTDACGHEHGAESQITRLTVLPYRVKFLFDKITFSSPLEDNTFFSDETVSVSYVLERFENSNATLPEFAIRAAGIAANLTGLVKEGQAFRTGTNTCEFKINGSLKSNTYIRLDFIDLTNNIIQPFYYPIKIK